ncbi:MAG: SPOR domain-containing protein [Acidobacteriota bacterium]|nr:MAG: SPOR domain-containing protein [Acidobacteriota bacterium]
MPKRPETTRSRADQPRVVEIELDSARIIALVGVFAACLGAAFLLGRATGRAGGATIDDGSVASSAPVAVPQTEEIDQAIGVFDRTGEQGAPREAGRQTTAEPSLGAMFEVDLGSASSRAEADQLQRRIAEAGLPPLVVGRPGGGYRIAAGPFSARSDAEEAAQRLRELLDRDARVVR